MVNNTEQYNMCEVVNAFNKFFVNIGPELAEQIPDCETPEKLNNYIDRSLRSMFLTAVDEREVIETVAKCTSKSSTDCEGIDMTIVKKIIAGISKPLTYICNLSFLTGIFLNKMKIAKVMPLYKTGNKHLGS